MVHFSYKNGLELLVHRDTKLKNSVLNVLYKVGSAHEHSTQTGLAHFLEHMMFEGSQNFPDFDRSLQGMMAENNAFTGQDYTCYYETFPNKYLEEMIDIELDRMSNLKILKSSIALQSKVIIEEFKETSINPPLADVWHQLQRLCFKNSYQWPVIGKNLKHIESIDSKSLKEFYKLHYRPNNSIWSIVTAIDEKTVADTIEKKIKATYTAETNIQEAFISSSKHKVTGSKKLMRSNVANPVFFLAAHIDDFTTKGYFLSDMLSDHLTNGESSLLYKALVLNSKLCTEIQSYTTENVHCNLLVIEGKLSKDASFDQVMDTIQMAFYKTIQDSLSQKKFETIYNKALTYWSFYHYNSSQLAQNMSIFYQAAGIVDLTSFLDSMYQSITIKDFKYHLSQLLQLERWSVLTYYPKN